MQLEPRRVQTDIGGVGGGGGAGAIADERAVQAVAATPGWEVVAAFYFAAAPPATVLEAIMLVSQGLLTGRVRIYDTVAAAVVAGSTLSTSSTSDARLVTADIAGVLVAGRIYQLQVECTGGTTLDDFVVLRSASLKKP